MDASDYSALVGRLERESDDTPRIYACKVAVVAAFGYVLIGAVVLAILACLAYCLYAFIHDDRLSRWSAFGAAVGGAALFAMVQALIVRAEPPAGRRVTREDVPDLFAAIDDVLQRMALNKGGKVRIIPLASVTLDNEFAVSICQIPQWGIFGNYSNHLQIGVPLLAVMNVAELKALLAHELGHLGGDYARFAGWIYRQRTTWQTLQQKVAEPNNLFERILGMFYRGYTPHFLAYTFVFARRHEYQADRAAAQATNPRVLARALVKHELAARFLSEIFWPRFFAQVERIPQPQYPPFAMLPKAFGVAQKEWLRGDWLQRALQRFAGESDTHPSLGERMTALGAPPELPTYAPDATSLALCGPVGPALLKWCDDEWQTDNALAWRKRHDAIKEARWKISQYENTAAEQLQPSDLWEKTLLLLDIGRQDDAVEELRGLVARDPSVARAQFLLGRLLLEEGDEKGLSNLTQAAKQDVELIEPAGHLGYGYLIERGRRGEAQRFWERIQAA